MDSIKKIGNITLNCHYYKGTDLYNEGDDVENIVLDCFKNNKDPVEILQNDNRWPLLYQLFDRREMIVDPMDIDKNCVVLEIGSGMGAVTGAIAKKAKKVECVDLSMRRCLANAYRNQKYDNIDIIVGNFEDINFSEKFDVITLIGVYEYAQYYIKSKNPYIDFLNKVSSLLNKNGKLYIAIENKLGMKYLAGSCEDHIGKPFAGIEGYSSSDRARTFTKSQITKLLENTGFKDIYFYYPYPDYKLPTVIYSDDYMPDSTSFFRMANYDLDRLVCFDEQKAYKGIISNITEGDELKVLFNSFLIEAVWK